MAKRTDPTFSIRIPERTLARMDEFRGEDSRTAFVLAAINSRLRMAKRNENKSLSPQPPEAVVAAHTAAPGRPSKKDDFIHRQVTGQR